jgi:transposase
MRRVCKDRLDVHLRPSGEAFCIPRDGRPGHASRLEVERELSRLELALQHIAEVEAVMSADAEESAGQVLEQ